MKYFIKTFGCQMNFSDSERIATFFEQNNFTLADKIDLADLVIFNTCGVRQMSEHKVYGHVHNVFKKRQGEFRRKRRCPGVNQRKKIVIVTGCLAHRKEFRKRLEKKVDLFIAIKAFLNLDKSSAKQAKILELIKNNKSTLNKLARAKYYHTLEYDSGCENDYLKIKPKYERKDSALVPIMTGCNNFCTYCIVPYARGREWSRPFNEITDEVRHLADKNYKRITLLGQNVNSYKDKKITFPILLDTLAKEFPKIEFKFLTSHPKDYSDKLIDVIAQNKNISRQIHLPIQAGSDKILKAMNRPYTQKHYLNLIKKTREKVPEAKISTDVIVGFPGESEKDFQETVKVFKKAKFSEAFINKYSPRPGTASFKLKDNVLLDEKKRRERILREYF